MRRGLSLGLALSSLLLFGCGQKKIGECNALIQVINSNVQGLEKTKPEAEGETGVKPLREMADAMDKVAADAAKVELTLPELKKSSTDYQNLVKEVGKAAREMASATESHDVTKTSAAQKEMEKAVERENPIIEGINGFCKAP